jgi:hypothetical protein
MRDGHNNIAHRYTSGPLRQFRCSPLCTQLEHALQRHHLAAVLFLLAAPAAAFVAPLVCGSLSQRN